MTWEIVAGIIALVGFVGSVCVWCSKLTRTLTALEVTLQNLQAVLEELKNTNKDEHKRLFKAVDNIEERVRNVEMNVERYHGHG